MNLANLSTADLAGVFLSFFLTLLVFSYVFGDNILFRFAIHLFIGVASGYAAVIAWYNVIWPQLILPLIAGSQADRLFVLIPLVLSLLLLFKAWPRLSRLGNPSIAYLVGVGGATAIGGAVLGTLFPQAIASINLFDLSAASQSEGGLWATLLKGAIILIGTLATLIYFQFSIRTRPGEIPARPEAIEFMGWIGKIFISITLGMLFAGVYIAALTALVERVHFIGDLLIPLIIH